MNPRRVAFDVLRQVTGDDAYANLALAKRLATAGLDARDAGLAAPKLILPALQVNIRGGDLPPPDTDGVRYLRLPLDRFRTGA